METAKIVLEDVGRVFAGGRGNRSDVVALDGVSFSIADRERVCLLGPSGCGKSTILNLVAGFDAPTTGSVSMGGSRVTGPGPDRGVVLQMPALFPWLTTWENVVSGPKWRGERRQDYTARARRTIAAVGLDGFESAYPYQLSGGMQQRAAIARALIGEPEVLLLDEPFGALDAQTRLQMQMLMLDVWDEFGTTVLFITHDVEEGLLLGDRVLTMGRRPGRIVHELRVDVDRSAPLEAVSASHFVEAKRTLLELLHRREETS